MTETLHIGDNLEFMKSLPSGSINLIYSDILYGTGRNFGDYQDIKADRKIVEAFYIPRIKEMHRLLKDDGSIYLQCDTRINHWLRLILDDIFGYNNFRNEIIWYYRKWANISDKFLETHDTILFYTKSNEYCFNLQYQEYSEKTKERKKNKLRLHGKKLGFQNDYTKGSPMHDCFIDIPFIPAMAIERREVNYPTQKPLALMERIVKASSNEGDICADFFAGSGSFGVTAKRLNRSVILCDINKKAIDICKKRLTAENNLFIQ